LIGAILYYLQKKIERIVAVGLRIAIHIRQVCNYLQNLIHQLQNEGFVTQDNPNQEEGVNLQVNPGQDENNQNQNFNVHLIRKSPRAKKPPQRYMYKE